MKHVKWEPYMNANDKILAQMQDLISPFLTFSLDYYLEEELHNEKCIDDKIYSNTEFGT